MNLYKNKGSIDTRSGFGSGLAELGRSNSNVVFSFIKDTDNDNFIKLSSENGIIGVNGHRSVGGIRVSLFNSIDDEMFEYFMNFFKQFLIENK